MATLWHMQDVASLTQIMQSHSRGKLPPPLSPVHVIFIVEFHEGEFAPRAVK